MFWRSIKHSVVVISSAESEYKAKARSLSVGMPIYYLLEEVDLKSILPAIIWYDNQTTLHIALNLVHHERMNILRTIVTLLERRFIKKLISTGYVKTTNNLHIYSLRL